MKFMKRQYPMAYASFYSHSKNCRKILTSFTICFNWYKHVYIKEFFHFFVTISDYHNMYANETWRKLFCTPNLVMPFTRSMTLDKLFNSEAQFCDLQVTIIKPTLLLFILKDIEEKIIQHNPLLIRHPMNHDQLKKQENLRNKELVSLLLRGQQSNQQAQNMLD